MNFYFWHMMKLGDELNGQSRVTQEQNLRISKLRYYFGRY